MRLLVVSAALIAGFLAAIPVATAQQPASQNAKKQARVEGTVLSSAGAPIPRATVRLIPQTPPALGGPVQPAMATANQDGTFVVENIEPGTYTLQAQRPGFVNTTYGQRRPGMPGTAIVLDEGASQKGLDITMIPQGVITGRITDVNGEPIQGVQVMALRQGYQRGVRALVTAGNASSNDLGDYRVANLQPGQYVVAAMDRRAIQLAIATTAAAGQPREGNVTTYYPNATDPKAAAPLSVAAGGELRADLRMRTGRMFSLAGKAVGPGGAAVTGAILALMPRDGADGSNPLFNVVSRTTMQVRTDGTFSASGIAAGDYILTTLTNVRLNGQALPNYVGRTELSFEDADITGFVFNVGPGAAISGTVTIDGDVPISALFPSGSAGDQGAAQTSVAATLAGVAIGGMSPSIGLVDISGTGLGNPPAGRIDTDGKFQIEAIGLSRFGILGAGLPAGFYVKSARYGGADVLKNGLDFSNGGGGEMTVVLSNKSATVTGVVRDSRGEAQSGQAVALWTEEPELATPARGVRTTFTDQNGGFKFSNLPPGKYYAAAFEEAEAGQIQNRDLLTLAAGEGKEVTLAESGTASEELKAISAEALAQYMAKLP